jgi:hypothetical protein
MFYRHRIFIAILLGIVVAVANSYLQFKFHVPSDFSIPLCGAKHLVVGLNPYSCSTNNMPSNPITTIVVLVPLSWLPVEIASAVIMGVSTGLLAYAVNRPQEPWRLLAFLSVPFVYSVQISQWAPLLLAAVYLEWLYPILLIKPHLGLSVGIMNFTPRRFVILVALGLASFLVQPNWIVQWWQQSSNYDGFIPLLSLPGIVLLLAVLRWRTRPAKWLLLLSLMPQRAWHDQLMLWTIPSNERQMILLTACSWLMWLPIVVFGLHFFGGYGNAWLIVSLFYPALGIVLANKEPQPYSGRQPADVK